MLQHFCGAWQLTVTWIQTLNCCQFLTPSRMVNCVKLWAVKKLWGNRESSDEILGTAFLLPENSRHLWNMYVLWKIEKGQQHSIFRFYPPKLLSNSSLYEFQQERWFLVSTTHIKGQWTRDERTEKYQRISASKISQCCRWIFISHPPNSHHGDLLWILIAQQTAQACYYLSLTF